MYFLTKVPYQNIILHASLFKLHFVYLLKIIEGISQAILYPLP